MAFLILIPIFLLPIILLCFYLYQKFFEDNNLMLVLLLLIVVLAALIYVFNRFHWDEKLTMRTAKYGIRFNDERKESSLPLLTYEFTREGKGWNTKLDSVSDPSKFVLLQKMLEENDDYTNAELEYNFLAKALNDSQVLYLRIQYNFITKNYYAETTLGKLTRPSYKINNLSVFEDCCSKAYKKEQVDSMLVGSNLQ